MNMQVDPKTMIERPDGSFIPFDKLEPAKQMEHSLTMMLCHEAELHREMLTKVKRWALNEMISKRQLMLDEYGVKRGGKDGGMTVRSACGTYMAKMTVSKHVTFGPQLEAAKALIFEFMEDELAKGGSEAIHEIVTKVFKLNGKGRLDTGGILGLREHKFKDVRWRNAMEAIEDAICRDSSTTYINFYKVDPHAEPKASGEERISLNFAEL